MSKKGTLTDELRPPGDPMGHILCSILFKSAYLQSSLALQQSRCNQVVHIVSSAAIAMVRHQIHNMLKCAKVFFKNFGLSSYDKYELCVCSCCERESVKCAQRAKYLKRKVDDASELQLPVGIVHFKCHPVNMVISATTCQY